MKKSFVLILFVFFRTVCAQEVPTVQIRTLCFERDATGIDRLAVLKPDMSVIEIKFPESFPSAKTKVPLEEGKVVFRDPSNLSSPPVALASIPSGLKNVLVMFFPSGGEEGEPAYKAVVMDASPKGIPEDGALVMNVFPEDVRVVVGEHRVLLKAGKSAGLARPNQRNDFNMAPVLFMSQKEREWKTIAETLVRFPQGQQQFFVSYPDSRSGRLAIRAYQIDDF